MGFLADLLLPRCETRLLDRRAWNFSAGFSLRAVLLLTNRHRVFASQVLSFSSITDFESERGPLLKKKTAPFAPQRADATYGIGVCVSRVGALASVSPRTRIATRKRGKLLVLLLLIFTPLDG